MKFIKTSAVFRRFSLASKPNESMTNTAKLISATPGTPWRIRRGMWADPGAVVPWEWRRQ